MYQQEVSYICGDCGKRFSGTRSCAGWTPSPSLGDLFKKKKPPVFSAGPIPVCPQCGSVNRTILK